MNFKCNVPLLHILILINTKLLLHVNSSFHILLSVIIKGTQVNVLCGSALQNVNKPKTFFIIFFLKLF